MNETLERGHAALTNTNTTVVYTVPNVTGDERALLAGLNVCNISASAADIIISVVASGGATVARYAYKEQLAGYSRRELVDGNGKLVLKAGETLRAAASIGNAFEVLATVVLQS